MHRRRSTWSATKTPRHAVTSRHADVYEMNQSRTPQPPVDAYDTGDPDIWAETPTKNENIRQEYDTEGGNVRRNELGFGEFRDDTWKHKDSDKWDSGGKYDNAKHAAARRLAAEKKAAAVEKISRAILRTSDEKLIEDQAVSLMGMPNNILAATLKRMNSVSPRSLPKHIKFKRALTCCKLAASMLPNNVSERHIVRLATTLMSVDSPVLKNMVKNIIIAKDDILEEEDTKESSACLSRGGASKTGDDLGNPFEDVADDDDPTVSTVSTVSGDDDDDDDDDSQTGKSGSGEYPDPFGVGEDGDPHGICSSKDEDDEDISDKAGKTGKTGLTGSDRKKLLSMIRQAQDPPVAPPVAPQVGPHAPADQLPGQDQSDLVDLFEGSPGIEGDPSVPGESEISFDVEVTSEAPGFTPVRSDSLQKLFSDDPEATAQREIVSATVSYDSYSNDHGLGVKTAGARKLGNIKASKVDIDRQLESIWERPS